MSFEKERIVYIVYEEGMKVCRKYMCSMWNGCKIIAINLKKLLQDRNGRDIIYLNKSATTTKKSINNHQINT